MPPVPTLHNALAIDLSPRVFTTDSVVASPQAATETIIATLTVSGDLRVNTGILLFGWAAYTVGANGVSANLRIRLTDASGTVVSATGATNNGILAAAQLEALSVQGFTATLTVPQVYVLTLTIGSGSAESTVSDVSLVALAC